MNVAALIPFTLGPATVVLGAPHRTNDLDGDKHRRTLRAAETASLKVRMGVTSVAFGLTFVLTRLAPARDALSVICRPGGTEVTRRRRAGRT